VLGAQRRFDHAPLDALHEAVERRVHGRVDDNSVAAPRHQLEHLDDPSHHIGDGGACRDVEFPTPAFARELGVGLGISRSRRISAVADGDRVLDGADDRLGERHIHLRDPQRQYVGIEVPPLGARAPAELLQ